MAANGTSSSSTKWTYKPQEPIGMQVYRAPSLLQPHRAREALRDAHDGKIPPLIGFFAGLASPQVVKVIAQLGWDAVWIDWEHASTNVESMTQMVHDVQHISEGKSMAFVRVPGHDHDSIGFALDAGASIVVPQVDTVEQAQHIVSAAKFGAKIRGQRSAPPARWMPGYSNTPINPSLTFWQNLNSQAAIVIQIETCEGIRNLDAILTACGEHIDSVWLGTLDCRVSMGLEGLVGNEPEWLKMKVLYESTLTKHDKPASGLALGDPQMRAMMAKGKSFIVTHSDHHALTSQGASLATVRETFPMMNYSGVYETL